MADVVVDVAVLVSSARLLTIEPARILAERYDVDTSGVDPEASIDPVHALDLKLRDDQAGFRARLNTDIETEIGKIACDVVAEYEIDGVIIDEESTPALQEFVNNVAVMHVLPYTRQYIADVTQRVFGSALVMPILQRGDLTFAIAHPNSHG